MTKTVHPVLKKTGAVLLAVLVLVLMAVPAFAAALLDAPTGYVYDGANVLSSSTESYIERTGSALAEVCGAEVVVATVDFTDGEDIADYAYDLFNKWGIGDKKENNGLLILLSIGAEDYYAEPGVGLTDVFTGGVLDAMLYDYLEDDFAAKEYDSGVKKVYARAVEILEDHYNVSYSTGTTNNANANTNYNYANNNTSGGILYGFQRFFSRVWRFFFVVLFVILIIALSVLRPRRRYYRRGWGAPPPPPPMGGFWRGPRPPRGPGGPGFGGPRPGGFSGGSRPSGGPRPGGGRSGGFGGGRSGGGAPRAGGGSTHGGGAGRRR